MALREYALFINGVYRSVLDEILALQTHLPEHIMYLQPHSGGRIVRLAKKPPSVDDRVQVLLSPSDDLNHVTYQGEIVGWDDKNALREHSQNGRRHAIERLLWTLQPAETGLFDACKGEKTSLNLLHVCRLTTLPKPLAVTTLKNAKSGGYLKGNRTTAGSWVYVDVITHGQPNSG